MNSLFIEIVKDLGELKGYINGVYVVDDNATIFMLNKIQSLETNIDLLIKLDRPDDSNNYVDYTITKKD